jgi:hypothetical protein
MPDLTFTKPFGLFTSEAPPEPQQAVSQPITLAPDNPELVLRDAVLEALEGRYESLLGWLRPRMEKLYRQRLASQGRELARCTADDARAILDADPHVPADSRLCKNFMGQLFKDGRWESTGQVIRSRTTGSHGNLLFCWRLKEQE